MKWYWFMCLSLVLGGVALFSIGRWGMARQAKPPVQSPTEPQYARSQMQGIKLIEQAGRATAWEIFADRAEFSEDDNVAVASGVRAQLFQDDSVLLSLQANRSIVQRQTGNITMQGQVRVTHQDGYTMTTDTLDWQAETRQLHTDDAVELEGPSVHVTGMGLQSDVDGQRFHLEQNVHASFRLR